MSDIYFDTFKEADVELVFDYTNEGDLLAAAITINHPIDDIGEAYKLEIVGYWYAPDIDEAFKRYAEMKKAFEVKTEEVYSKVPQLVF